MKELSIDVTYDKIRSFIDGSGTTKLSVKDKEILSRMEFAYDNLKTESIKHVANRLISKFGIKKSQAYVDIRNAQRMFNAIHRRDVDWLRNYIVENAIEQIEFAKQTNNARAWQLASQDILKVFALEKNDKEEIDLSLLGNNNYFIVINNGVTIEKLDYDKLHEMPIEKRQEKIKFLHQDVDDAQIIDIINS